MACYCMCRHYCTTTVHVLFYQYLEFKVLVYNKQVRQFKKPNPPTNLPRAFSEKWSKCDLVRMRSSNSVKQSRGGVLTC